MIWWIVSLKPHTGDVAEYLYSYSNRGHAIARLRGLRRHARASKMEFSIRKG